MTVSFNSIGTIHTPYLPSLPIPHQPQPNAPGEFWISIKPEYREAIADLRHFRYIYVLFYLDQVSGPPPMTVSPPWANGAQVSLFASRSPNRPNPIGLSIVEVKGIEDTDIIISGIDAYNGTPVLDIKPYMLALDCKPDANNGWVETLEDGDHLLAHLTGTPHHHEGDHGHSHHHYHEHIHNHSHGHDHAHLYDHGHLHRHDHSHAHKHDHPHDQGHDSSHAHNHQHCDHDHGHGDGERTQDP